jgi:CheY-like chemotaxis protein
MATVMVVDDDPDVLATVANILTLAGHTVEPFGSAHEALTTIYSRKPPDLLLADVAMPGMTGFQLAQRVHRDRPSVKVLYLSGYWNSPEVQRDKTERYGQLLHKPILPAALCQAVDETLKGAA